MTNRNPISSWIPRTTGTRCLLAAILGVALGGLLGKRAEMFSPVGDILLRSMTMMSVPFLVLEITGSLAVLGPVAASRLLRRGLWILLGIVVLGSTAVVTAPLVLPRLASSPLFHPSILTDRTELDLVATLLPSNLFMAFASGNYAGLAIVSTVVGLAIQQVPERQSILSIIQPLRLLTNKLMGWVICGLSPIGTLAIVAKAVGMVDSDDLRRMIGLFVTMLIPSIVFLLVVIPGCLNVLLGIHPLQFLRAIRGPMVLAVSIGNLPIVLPTLHESIRAELQKHRTPDADIEADLAGMEAFVLFSFTVVSLGKILCLIFIPFAAWHFDMPISPTKTLRMLLTGLPSISGGTYFALIGELRVLGLPEGLASYYFVNHAWMNRLADAVTLATAFAGSLFICLPIRARITRLMGLAALTVAASLAFGILGHGILNRTLQESNRTASTILDRRLMATNAFISTPPINSVSKPGPVTSTSIRERGVLRAGLRGPKPPWIYRNRVGEWVGYDIELMARLAQSLGVGLELWTLDQEGLGSWLADGRIDLVLGGIDGSGIRNSTRFQAVYYEQVHLALLTRDEHAPRLQAKLQPTSSERVTFASDGLKQLSYDLKQAIRHQLRPGTAADGLVLYRNLIHSDEAFNGLGTEYDALISSAEEGSALAVLNPQLIMIPAFGREMKAGISLLIRESDSEWGAYLQDWVFENHLLGNLDRIRNHWLCFKPIDSSGD